MLHTQNKGDIGRYMPGTRTGSFTTLEDFTFFFSFFSCLPAQADSRLVPFNSQFSLSQLCKL